MSAPKARAILDDKKPDSQLAEALTGIHGLLSLPLFGVEEQQVVQRIIRARRLLLMGESADPAPDEIELAEALEDSDVPYVAIGHTVLRLPPILVWELVQQRANTRLLFLDKVADQSCHYKTVEGDEAPGRLESITEVAELCSGRKRLAERVELRDGRHLAREWGERSRLIEETGARGKLREMTKIDYANKQACCDCPLRPRCTDAGYRAVSRLEHEDALDRMAARLKARPEILDRRRETVEHPFGSIKQWMYQGAFLMRGLQKVRAEFSLTALVYNLRRVLNIVGMDEMMAAVAA